MLTGRLMTHIVEVLADQVSLDIPAGRPFGMHFDCQETSTTHPSSSHRRS
jgi:hypothetical protein